MPTVPICSACGAQAAYRVFAIDEYSRLIPNSTAWLCRDHLVLVESGALYAKLSGCHRVIMRDARLPYESETVLRVASSEAIQAGAGMSELA